MPLIQVRQSAVHGRGVFATRPIRKGRRIIEYTGRRVAWKSIPAEVNDAHTFLFGINDGTDVIDPRDRRERSALDQPLLRPELRSDRGREWSRLYPCLTQHPRGRRIVLRLSTPSGRTDHARGQS